MFEQRATLAVLVFTAFAMNAAAQTGTFQSVDTGSLTITGTNTTQMMQLVDWATGSTIWNFGIGDASGDYFSIGDGSTNTNRFVLQKTTGNVGIGTTSPGYTLDVAGDINTSGVLRLNGAGFQTFFQQAPANGLNGLNATAALVNFDGYDAAVPNFPTGSWNVSAISVGNPIRGFQIGQGYSDGSPWYRVGNGSWGAWYNFLTTQNYSSVTGLSNNNGNVGIGIGTTTPAQLLQVGATYSQNPSLLIGGHDGNNSSVGNYSLLFGAWRDVEPTVTSGIVATPTWTCCGGYPAAGTGSYPGIRENTLGFYTIYDPASPSNYAPNMFIATSGSVGIGTTTPGAKLEVSGSLKLTSGSGGSITFQDGTVQSTAFTGVLCGGDYAESVDVTGDRTKYEPGDVLIADPDHDGRFLKSAVPYATGVLGVYSTKPGAVGRRQTTPKSTAEVPMAMIGIVPTKVSAENGAIKPGDLLVTSSTPGYAMKGTDRSLLAGAVIGKALGHLDVGKGVIEVGVTLQ